MRVGPYAPQNIPRQNQRSNVPPNRRDNSETGRYQSSAMAMAQKILTEQGETQAAYFLYAIRPFVAPAELASIEQRLNVRSRRNPEFEAPHPDNNPGKQAKGGMDMQMMQMLMGLMNSKSKPDPMTLLKLMNNSGK